MQYCFLGFEHMMQQLALIQQLNTAQVANCNSQGKHIILTAVLAAYSAIATTVALSTAEFARLQHTQDQQHQ